ncbi:MAG: hypothetical protein H7Z72_13350 [Bacteroidetes bacterium]|nr:hypothetical protein [Fibrella sp.]
MTWTSIIDVNEGEVTLKLPANFKNKTVLISVEDVESQKAAKLRQMQSAATDPLFLADIDEVQADFRAIDGELV